MTKKSLRVEVFSCFDPFAVSTPHFPPFTAVRSELGFHSQPLPILFFSIYEFPAMGNEGEAGRGAIFRDIRRYYCEYCGICRSKKSLISSHIMSQHREEIVEKERNEGEGDGDGKKLNTCDECGVSFFKPAHLKQHLQSHSIEIESCRLK